MPIKKAQIYRYLKKHGKSPLNEIVSGIHGVSGEVADLLDIEVARGYIRKDTSKDPSHYSLRIILGPLTSKDKIAPLWRHKEIVQRAGIQKINIVPQSQLKALLDALFWWQGGRGTCVGFAGSLYKWRLYMMDTGDIPSVEEIKAAGKIVEQDIGCTAGVFKYITMARTFFSPQWIYDRSRKFGKAIFPAGSDTTWAAKTIANEGAVPWNECLTSITGLCAPELWPMVNADYNQTLARLAPIAALHTNKFAASNSFTEVFEAIKAGKSVFGPVNLPPEYLHPPGGQWQSYGGDSAGGHAVYAAFVDEVFRLIITRGSWDGDDGEKYYSFDEQFFDQNAGPFLIGLTQEEAKIGEALYKSLTITANVPAWVRVDGVQIGTTPQKLARQIGKIYQITVGADGYIAQPYLVDDSTKDPLDVMLDPVIPTPQPVKNWYQPIIDLIKSLIALFR